MIERVHSKLKKSLRAYNQNMWSAVIPFVTLAWNNSVVNDQMFTPAQLVFGQNQRLPGDILINNPELRPPSQEFVDRIKELMNDYTPIFPSHHPNKSSCFHLKVNANQLCNRCYTAKNNMDRGTMYLVHQIKKQN